MVFARSPWPLTAVFALGHLAFAIALPLIEDEAYYALWASDPAWGYYDHPPMIAWMIWLGETVLGRTEAGVRIVAVLAMALAAPMVWRIAMLASGDRRTALYAMLVWLVSPLVLALSKFATPDAPSALFWAATLWALAEALDRGAKGLPDSGWWLVAGAAAGLGILSKFTNLFLPVGLLAWLLLTRAGRAALVTWKPWGAAAIMLLTLVPLALWNLQNDWIGLERQFGRVTTGEWSFETFASFIGVAWLLFSPLGVVFLARGVRGAAAITGLLAVSSLPLALYLLWHSTQHGVQANWILPIHAPIAVLVGMGLRHAPRIWPITVIASAALLGAVLLGLAFKPGPPLSTAHSPPNQWRGWADTTPAIAAAAEAAGAEWIATRQYGLTGHLWWHLPELDVWQVDEPERYLFRGPLPEGLCNAPALLVERAGRGAAPGQIFEHVGPSSEIARRDGAAVLFTYRVTAVRQLRSCPSEPPIGD